MTVQDVLSEKLRLVPFQRKGEWELWEHKTFNLHRGGLVWRPGTKKPSREDAVNTVREKVRASFPISWWRGFAFGMLLETPGALGLGETCASAVDRWRNAKGAWTWVLLADPVAQAATGVHTWQKGYLTSVYTGLIRQYESEGWDVDSFQLETPRWARLAQRLSRIHAP